MKTEKQTVEKYESETEGESPERMGDSLKRQIPTVGRGRREDKQQRESFVGSYGREQK